MPTIKLTQMAVERLKAPDQGRIEYFDAMLPGFGLRVSAPSAGRKEGHKAWIVLYRIEGRLRRYTIGSLAAFPKVEVARERAGEILRDAERGIDAGAIKAAPPEAVRAPDTVSSVCNDFIRIYAKPRNRTWRDTERLLARHVVSRWGTRDILSVTRRDILDLLDELTQQGSAVGANRVLAALRKLFVWAEEREIIPSSPAVRIKPPAKEVERDRVVSDAEISAIWHGTGHAGVVAGSFVRVLLLTAQRRSEVATMRWQDLNLDTRVWTLPREATKSNRSHEVPLSAIVIEIMSQIPRAGDFVFTTDGRRPISGFSKIKLQVDKLSDTSGWRFHDLRRTAATTMARLGIATSTISRVLNHEEGGVTAIYNRYSYLDEKRRALETWAQSVGALVGLSSSNVIALRA